jgi:hypothetical protein
MWNFKSVMDTSKNTYRPSLPLGVLLSLLLFSATSIGTMTEFDGANAQNATTGTNQTVTATANQTETTMQNQTTTALANLTNADFGQLRELLALVRESLQDNDPVAGYQELGWADNEIFMLAGDLGNQNKTFLVQLKPVQDTIQKAQEAIQQGNSATALDDLGSAEVALLHVTQQLPAGEDEDDATEETEEATE